MWSWCVMVFTSNFSFSPEAMLENADRFNTAFGGVTPGASNVLYIHGELDPWRTVGVQNDDNNNSTVVIVIEGGHF